MFATIFCIMSKNGPEISDTTESVLTLGMDLIITVLLIFTFKPTVSGIKALVSDVAKKINKKEILYIVLCKGLIAVGGVKIFIDISYLLDGNNISNFIYDVMIKINTPVQYLIYAVIMCVLCPTSDELIFRNIIFKSLSKRFSAWTGLIITSILFGAVSIGNGIVAAFVFSIISCIMYVKYKNILMSIVVNLANSVLVYIAVIFNASKRLKGVFFSTANIAVSLSIGCLMMLLGLILFVKFFSKNKKYIYDYNNELKGNLEVHSI